MNVWVALLGWLSSFEPRLCRTCQSTLKFTISFLVQVMTRLIHKSDCKCNQREEFRKIGLAVRLKIEWTYYCFFIGLKFWGFLNCFIYLHLNCRGSWSCLYMLRLFSNSVLVFFFFLITTAYRNIEWSRFFLVAFCIDFCWGWFWHFSGLLVRELLGCFTELVDRSFPNQWWDLNLFFIYELSTKMTSTYTESCLTCLLL